MTDNDAQRKTMIVNVFSADLPVGFLTIKISTVKLEDATLGGVGFDAEHRLIYVQLNLRHPGIFAALAAKDEETLRAYVCEQIWLVARQIRERSGNDPWDHEDWPEFLAVCEKVGRKVRPRPGFDPGKIQ